MSARLGAARQVPLALPHASRIGDLRAGSRARSARPFTISKLASHALRTTNSHSLQFLLFRRRLNRCRSNGARKSTDRGRATREVCLRGTCACKRAHAHWAHGRLPLGADHAVGIRAYKTLANLAATNPLPPTRPSTSEELRCDLHQKAAHPPL